MGRRTVLLIAAVVVAALGVTLIFLYVNGAQSRAYKDAELLQILVATENIAAGTTAAQAQEAGQLEQKQIPAGLFPDGGLSDIAPISDQVALSPIFAGQQILAQQFGQPSESSTLSIPKDKIAISVQLGDPNRVAGFVVPGSQVAVFVTLPSQANRASGKTQVILTRAEVIGVGPSTVTTQTTSTDSGQTTEQISNAILTLALTQQEAQQVIYGQDQGPLYFALLNDTSSVKSGNPTNDNNLFR
ncbi:MAG: Flp pilus assembly protein CpaB [Actinomycetes bacterium]